LRAEQRESLETRRTTIGMASTDGAPKFNRLHLEGRRAGVGGDR
jgi:hypothetical protein